MWKRLWEYETLRFLFIIQHAHDRADCSLRPPTVSILRSFILGSYDQVTATLPSEWITYLYNKKTPVIVRKVISRVTLIHSDSQEGQNVNKMWKNERWCGWNQIKHWGRTLIIPFHLALPNLTKVTPRCRVCGLSHTFFCRVPHTTDEFISFLRNMIQHLWCGQW